MECKVNSIKRTYRISASEGGTGFFQGGAVLKSLRAYPQKSNLLIFLEAFLNPIKSIPHLFKNIIIIR